MKEKVKQFLPVILVTAVISVSTSALVMWMVFSPILQTAKNAEVVPPLAQGASSTEGADTVKAKEGITDPEEWRKSLHEGAGDISALSDEELQMLCLDLLTPISEEKQAFVIELTYEEAMLVSKLKAAVDASEALEGEYLNKDKRGFLLTSPGGAVDPEQPYLATTSEADYLKTGGAQFCWVNDDAGSVEWISLTVAGDGLFSSGASFEISMPDE